uniref:Putative tryptophan 2,3-dioxygenase n=1 Tax=Streptomyces griseofuscus TaxID=146922 RepID=W8Q978_9ACTN|nr:putative tryptophan 2,3-dioxygenase [Streptomyces griseofuscus]
MTTPTERAERAVDTWLQRIRKGPPGPFPHRLVTRAVQAHGSTALPERLRGQLIDAWDWSRSCSLEPGSEEWATAAWLECLTSSLRNAPSYGAYTMTSLFGRWSRLGDFPRRNAQLSALLTADLIRYELRRATHEDHLGERRSRSTAATLLARHLDEDRGWAETTCRPKPEGGSQAIQRCNHLLSAGGRGLPAPLALLVESSLPVATTEPDEPLFIRSVQIMELLAEQAAFHLGEAHRRARAATPEPSSLAMLLHATADSLDRAQHVFRLVSTIDPTQFAAIRAATAGTGALQSTGFARLERCCRGEAGLRPETVAAVGLVTAPTPAPSLSTTLARVTTRLETHDPTAAGHLRLAIQAVNAQWQRWKRTHLGVAKKIIGDVPGTGGTDGVRYLARHLEEPLL